MSDNSELLKQLLEEQQRTNLLLAMAENRARQEQQNKERARIAEQYGVDPSQVFLDDGPTFTIVRRRDDQEKTL